MKAILGNAFIAIKEYQMKVAPLHSISKSRFDRPLIKILRFWELLL